MSQKHPDLSELLLWQSGDLDPDESELIGAHISNCAQCDEELYRANLLLGDVAAVDVTAAQRRMHAAVRDQRRTREQETVSRRKRIAKFATAGTVVTLCFVLVMTTLTPSARADSWLAEASTRELRQPRRAMFMQVKRIREGNVCRISLMDAGERKRQTSATTDFCESVESSLRTAGWSWKDLLSAASFQRWRTSLVYKSDAVHSTADYRSITTTTDSSLLHEVTIRLGVSDYHVVSTSFRLALPSGLERLDVSEDTDTRHENVASVRSMPRTDPMAAVPKAQHVAPKALGNPLDEPEALTRLILHRTGQDRNPLIRVERRHETIEVSGIAPTDSIKQTLRSMMAPLSQVQLSIVSEAEAQQAKADSVLEGFHGDAAPLAAEKIRRLFHNNPDARARFVNDLDSTSLRLMGASRSRDAVLLLASRIHDSTYTPQLRTAAAELASDIHTDAEFISRQLSPLIGTEVPVTTTPITSPLAAEIYELVHEVVFLSNSSKGLTLESALERLQEILSTP